MRVVFMTGSHPRHAYVARQVAASGLLSGLVIEERAAFVPAPPEGLRAATRALFVHHFAAREAAETRFFGVGDTAALPEVDTLHVTRDELNGARVHAFLQRHKPDLLLSYGVHKLTSETLALADGYRWNIHGGLSPWYRGVITHFWPSYMLEPQMTGMTMHDLTEAIDGGAVVYQCAAEMVRGDGLHDVAGRAVSALGERLPELLQRVAQGPPVVSRPQTTTGRIWRSADWRPDHLHFIYETHQDRIVDRYLDGHLEHRAPRLVDSVFK